MVAMTRLFREFFNSEKAGGLILIASTAFSILLANSSVGIEWTGIWKTPVAGHDLAHWINDGLMAVFFLLIGLELEREVYAGELSGIRAAVLPVSGALGGMLIPAGIYLAFNVGTPGAAGAGIPMATDIAFALGILSLLGKRVPASWKIFLTSLAVIDDLGAIMVIALFYASTLVLMNLAIALAIFAVLILLNRLRVHNLIPYLAGGVVMWYFMLHSGVHATITGVLLAFAIPFGDGGERSPSFILQHYLHIPVAFIILPLFALANTALVIDPGTWKALTQPVGLGIALGLFAGKPLGIFLFTSLAVAARLARFPAGFDRRSLIGLGFLAGIGFTMSIFIAMLAFDDPATVTLAKTVVLMASCLAGMTGLMVLRFRRRHRS